MRQLDLFGSLFETPSQEEKPEEKAVVSKKEVSKNADAAPSYSKNALRSERTAAAASSEGLTPVNNEKLDTSNESFLQSMSPSNSLFSSFDAPVADEVDLPEVTTIIVDIEEPQRNEDIQATDAIDVEIITVSEVSIEPEVLIIEQECLSTLTPDTNSLPDIAVTTSDPIVTKQKKQKLPELERTGSVVFDDGKISVKIKTKSPFPAPLVKEKKQKPKKIAQKRGRKSFKEIDAEVDLIEIPDDEILFQKQYYAISEVAKWFRVNTSLLRFWENEFDVLKPRKNRKGDRLFRPEDVKNLQLIYQLLRQRKYTIEGAKEYIKTNKKKADIQLQLTNTLQKFKSFLLDMKANLQ